MSRDNRGKPKRPQTKTSEHWLFGFSETGGLFDMISQNVPKPERAQTKLVSSQSIVSVKAVTIKFYSKIILRSKLILKLL